MVLDAAGKPNHGHGIIGNCTAIQYRLENKITQQDLAKELGVAFSTVSRWFNGKTVPSKIQQYHVEKYLTQKKIILPAKSGKEVK